MTEQLHQVDWRRATPLRFSPALEAALTEFQAAGLHGASMRGIARRAELSTPTLYYRFGTKERMLAVLLDAFHDTITSAARAADADGDDPAERLRHVTEACVTVIAARPEVASLVSEMPYLTEVHRSRQTAKAHQISTILSDILTAGIASGQFNVLDVRETVRALRGMILGIADWFQPSGTLSAPAIARRYAGMAQRLVTD